MWQRLIARFTYSCSLALLLSPIVPYMYFPPNSSSQIYLLPVPFSPPPLSSNPFYSSFLSSILLNFRHEHDPWITLAPNKYGHPLSSSSLSSSSSSSISSILQSYLSSPQRGWFYPQINSKWLLRANEWKETKITLFYIRTKNFWEPTFY